MFVEYVDSIPEDPRHQKRPFCKRGLLRIKLNHFAKSNAQVLHLKRSDTPYITSQSMQSQAEYIIKDEGYDMLAFRREDSLYVIKLPD